MEETGAVVCRSSHVCSPVLLGSQPCSCARGRGRCRPGPAGHSQLGQGAAKPVV